MCAGISVFLQILVVMSVRVCVCVLFASFYRYCYAPHLANNKKAGLVACGALKSIATATGFCPAVCVLVCLCGSASRGRIIIILPCPQRFLLPSHITRTVYVVLRSSLPCPARPGSIFGTGKEIMQNGCKTSGTHRLLFASVVPFWGRRHERCANEQTRDRHTDGCVCVFVSGDGRVCALHSGWQAGDYTTFFFCCCCCCAPSLVHGRATYIVGRKRESLPITPFTVKKGCEEAVGGGKPPVHDVMRVIAGATCD